MPGPRCRGFPRRRRHCRPFRRRSTESSSSSFSLWASPWLRPCGRRAGGAGAGAGAGERRLDEGRNAGHARTGRSSRRPPSLRADHAPAWSQHRRGVSTSWNAMPGLAVVAAHRMDPTGRRGAGQRGTSGGGLLRRSTGEGHGATTGRRSMAMAMAMAGNGRKALEIEGSKGLPRDRGIGGGHRWRGGERRGGLSLAGGVDRGALQNEGLGTCRPRMYLKRAGNGGTAARQTAHHHIVRSCRLPLHALFLPAGTLSQNHTGIQIPTFCAAKTDQIKM